MMKVIYTLYALIYLAFFLMVLLSLGFVYCISFAEHANQRGECGIGGGMAIVYSLIIYSLSFFLTIILRKKLYSEVKFIIWWTVPVYLAIIMIMSLSSPYN